MIPGVERFQAKLESPALREVEILKERQIPVLITRPAELIPGGIANGARQRLGEG